MVFDCPWEEESHSTHKTKHEGDKKEKYLSEIGREAYNILVNSTR